SKPDNHFIQNEEQVLGTWKFLKTDEFDYDGLDLEPGDYRRKILFDGFAKLRPNYKILTTVDSWGDRLKDVTGIHVRMHHPDWFPLETYIYALKQVSGEILVVSDDKESA